MNTDNPHIESVIIATERRGEGVEDSPVRGVLRIYTLKGELIAEKDSWMEQRMAEIVMEHMQRGREIEQLRRVFDEAQADCAKQIARVHHLEQCISNYKARMKAADMEIVKARQRKSNR